jgi:hypothetical protein
MVGALGLVIDPAGAKARCQVRRKEGVVETVAFDAAVDYALG